MTYIDYILIFLQPCPLKKPLYWDDDHFKYPKWWVRTAMELADD